MKTYLVVTITCPDRPGVVEQITELVLSHSANWEDSRMARLGGDFAGIVLISVSDERAGSLTQALQALANDSTTVAVKATHDPPATPAASHHLLDLSLTGADHE
jgi:glycine cleavage system regulatory protein